MINDPVILNDWYVVGRSSDLAEGCILAARLFDENLVLWRKDAFDAFMATAKAKTGKVGQLVGAALPAAGCRQDIV